MFKVEDIIDKVICGDCLEVMRDMPSDSVDLVLTDPPYGIKRFENVEQETSGVFAKKGTFKGASLWNNKKPTYENWDEIFRISKNQIIWGGNNFPLPTTEYFIIWDKIQMMPNFARCEYAWVSMGLKKPAKIFQYSVTNIIHEGRTHPAQKPRPLFNWILKNYTKEGDIICDPYFGSGTTGVACIAMGRHYIGIEISPDYCKIAEARIEEEKAKYGLFES